MPYEGPAAVTVSAEYLGHAPVRHDNPVVSVRLTNAGPGLVDLHFDGSLTGPSNATHVRVTLPNGLSLHGAIIQGAQGAAGGWLSFRADPASLADLGLA